MADVDGDPAVAMCFSVVVESKDLGVFTACEGLGWDVVMETREEGGNSAYVHHLPVRMKYPNVKLTRPINKDSEKVADWIASMAGDIVPAEATITAMRLDGEVIASWGLRDVLPVSWRGPSLNVTSTSVANETLELAHHGFAGGPA